MLSIFFIHFTRFPFVAISIAFAVNKQVNWPVSCRSKVSGMGGWGHRNWVANGSRLRLLDGIWDRLQLCGGQNVLRSERKRSVPERGAAARLRAGRWHHTHKCDITPVRWEFEVVLYLFSTVLCPPLRRQQVCGGDRDWGGAWWPRFVHYDLQHL